jgi:hypothetical protein
MIYQRACVLTWNMGITHAQKIFFSVEANRYRTRITTPP